MELYSYVIPRDYGFAPNPFYGFCTLSTCKPQIRSFALVSDWVIGTGTKQQGLENRLVFAMKVTEKITFNQYWKDQKFQYKKPNINGSLKQTYGDNIYYFDNESDKWYQSNSHHSYDDGSINYYNLKRDTSKDAVLISDHFFYFGDNCVEIPNRLVNSVVKKGPGHRRIKDEADIFNFLNWLNNSFEPGYHGNPRQFNSFRRYSGV
jgi:hypothetical protein